MTMRKPPAPLPPNYTRTALVLWSRRNHLDVLYSDPAGLERACAALDAAGDEPTEEERALFDFVLARAGGEALKGLQDLVYAGTDLKLVDLEKKSQLKRDLLAQESRQEARA